MKITFYAHASFRLEADGLTVITDPYTPGPRACGFDPIDEPADLVIMSSATDAFHSESSHVRGNPTVINALELPPEGMTVRGLHIRSFPAMESYTFDFGRDPDANALYLFTLGGIRVLRWAILEAPFRLRIWTRCVGTSTCSLHSRVPTRRLRSMIWMPLSPPSSLGLSFRCTITVLAACSTSCRSTTSSHAIRADPSPGLADPSSS